MPVHYPQAAPTSPPPMSCPVCARPAAWPGPVPLRASSS